MGFQDWQAVEGHPAVGPLWETYVIMEVVKSFAALDKNIPLWFWRTAYGDEVDLIIEKDGRFTAIECKYGEVVSSSSLKGLKAFTNAYGRESIKTSYVASRTTVYHPLTDGITAIPGNLIADYV